MDMVYNNPGEKPFDVKFNDPYYLKSEGYNSMAPPWHVNCLITYDNFNQPKVRQVVLDPEQINL